MQSKAMRREKAIKLAKARANRTDQEQLARLDSAGERAQKERAKLKKRIEGEKAQKKEKKKSKK